jgi:hypothetical protein
MTAMKRAASHAPEQAPPCNWAKVLHQCSVTSICVRFIRSCWGPMSWVGGWGGGGVGGAIGHTSVEKGGCLAGYSVCSACHTPNMPFGETPLHTPNIPFGVCQMVLVRCVLETVVVGLGPVPTAIETINPKA